MFVDPSVREYVREVGILDGDLCRSFLGNQVDYLRSTGRVDICIDDRAPCSIGCLIGSSSGYALDLLPLGFVTKLTAYR